MDKLFFFPTPDISIEVHPEKTRTSIDTILEGVVTVKGVRVLAQFTISEFNLDGLKDYHVVVKTGFFGLDLHQREKTALDFLEWRALTDIILLSYRAVSDTLGHAFLNGVFDGGKK